MSLKWSKIFVMLFFSVTLSFAQELVKGVVKDENGLPLPGVTVVVKGKTSKGVATDFDGNYSISVEKGAVLVFSFVGMKTIERKPTSSVLNITMEVDAQELSDVVVVGYSTVKKEDFVGSATQVNTEAIANKNVSTVSAALAGEVAGVRVINTTGQPGKESTIRIRGFGSVNGNRSPLYVLDGVPYTGALTSINPDDIENLVVLKDAAATAVYGARGANGVVLITTKRGVSGKSEIVVESKMGYNTLLLPRYETIQSPEQYIQLSWEALYNRGVLSKSKDPIDFANKNLFGRLGISSTYNIWGVEATNLIDSSTKQIRQGVSRIYNPENWADYAFQASLRTENNVSIKGGEGKTTYYTSIGHLSDTGYSLNSSYERLSARMNLAHRAKPWLRGEFNLGYSFSKWNNNGQSEDSDSVFYLVEGMPSIYPLYKRDEKGNKIFDSKIGGYVYDTGEDRGFQPLTNAIAQAVLDKNKSERHSLNTNFLVGIDFTKNISFDARLGVQYYTDNEDNYSNPYYGGAESVGGSLDKYRVTSLFYTALQMLKYNNRFGNHGINAFIAHEANNLKRNYLSANKSGLVIPTGEEFANAIETKGANSYITDYALESYFAQVMYDYDNKYLFSGSVRRDGSSRFLKNKWGNFGSVGLGWVASKENFLKNNSFINYLKIKASYGVIGDQGGVGYYPGYNVYTSANFMGIAAATFDRAGYPDLTWERANIFQVGGELTLFESKLVDLTVEYYNKKTTNLIFDSRLAPSTGNAILKTNDGILQNQGLELGLTTHLINKKDLFLDFTFNAEFLKNKLLKLPKDTSTGKEKVIDISGAYARVPGRSIYDFYLKEWAGVNPETGAAQWTLNYVDKNDNKAYDKGEEISSLYEWEKENPGVKYLEGITENYTVATRKFNNKSAVPLMSGSFSLTAGYKGFKVSAQFLYGLGAYGYDGHYAGLMHNRKVGSQNWSVDILNRWQKPGDITDVPRLSSQYETDLQFNSLSTRFLRKSDYLALNNVTVSYTLGQSVAKHLAMKDLTFTLTGDNLWLKTNKVGYNPITSEVGSSSAYTYHPLSNITFGVKARF